MVKVNLHVDSDISGSDHVSKLDIQSLLSSSFEVEMKSDNEGHKLVWKEVKDILLLKKLFEKYEERPTPSAVYNWRIYGTALIASAAAIIIGYDGGFIGGTVALNSFREEFGLDKMTSSHADYIISNIISVFHAGCFFGALFSYPFSYYWGRRISLIIAAVTITLSLIHI